MFRIGGKAAYATTLVIALGITACSSTKRANTDATSSEDISLETLEDEQKALSELGSDETINFEDSTENNSSDANTTTVEIQIEDEDSVVLSSNQQASQNGHRRTPKLANQPFEQDGFVLNAYYVVQSEQETYSTLSQLFYGRPERADLISSWNSNKAVTPGAIIYYNSHFRVKDTKQMLSFYEDYGFEWTSYQIQAGDSLSGIAKRLYNTHAAWKNLAIYNPQLSNPDHIQVGDTIKLPPMEFDADSRRQEALAMATGGMQKEGLKVDAPQNSAAEENIHTEQAPHMPTQDIQQEAAQVQAQPRETSLKDRGDEKGLANIDEAVGSLSNDEKIKYIGIALLAVTILLLIARRRARSRA